MDAAGPQLRVISNMAVGVDNIDVAAATSRGILVTNTPGVLTDATADLTWALILSTVRRVVEGDRMVREGRFEPLESVHAARSFRRRRDTGHRRHGPHWASGRPARARLGHESDLHPEGRPPAGGAGTARGTLGILRRTGRSAPQGGHRDPARASAARDPAPHRAPRARPHAAGIVPRERGAEVRSSTRRRWWTR